MAPAVPTLRRSGLLGWALVAGVVLAWDLAAPETMSAAFRRGQVRPVTAVVLAGAWLALTAHLFELLPHDPIDRAHLAWQRRGHVRP